MTSQNYEIKRNNLLIKIEIKTIKSVNVHLSYYNKKIEIQSHNYDKMSFFNLYKHNFEFLS